MKMLDRMRAHRHLGVAEPAPQGERARGNRGVQSPSSRGSRVCAACGQPALTTDEFVAKAKEAGFVVDPLTGDEVPSSVSGVVGSIGDLAGWERERQQRFDAVEARRGYVCSSCGKAHCTDCLMKTPPHPVTRGPRCPSCGEGPHEMLGG